MRCPRHFHDLLFKKRKIIREWHKEKKKAFRAFYGREDEKEKEEEK